MATNAWPSKSYAENRGPGPPSIVASVPGLTKDSQIGLDLRVCADAEDRTDFDQRR